MSDHIDVLIEDDRWTTLDLPALAETCLIATLAVLDLRGDFSVSILACDDARIAELNGAFRNKPSPTNVLSWPSDDLSAADPGAQPHLPEAPELGDIALAFETVLDEAQKGHISLQSHTSHLLIHAILHLLGYDHETDEDAALMEGLEIATLAKLGIANPY